MPQSPMTQTAGYVAVGAGPERRDVWAWGDRFPSNPGGPLMPRRPTWRCDGRRWYAFAARQQRGGGPDAGRGRQLQREVRIADTDLAVLCVTCTVAARVRFPLVVVGNAKDAAALGIESLVSRLRHEGATAEARRRFVNQRAASSCAHLARTGASLCRVTWRIHRVTSTSKWRRNASRKFPTPTLCAQRTGIPLRFSRSRRPVLRWPIFSSKATISRLSLCFT